MAAAVRQASNWYVGSKTNRVPRYQKRPGEVVSRADIETERVIRSAINYRLPEDHVVGEELGGMATDTCWSVDPIDGTANFLAGSPLWGISIAYIDAGIPTLGAIALPALGLTISASSGRGVLVNDTADARNRCDISVVAVGENNYWNPSSLGSLERALRDSGSGVVSYRSAAVGLAFTALGYISAYIECHTNRWDIAAGEIICREAGIIVRRGSTATTVDDPAEWIFAGEEELAGIWQRWQTGADSAELPAPGTRTDRIGQARD